MDDGNGSNRTFRILSGKLEKLVPYNHLGTGFEGSIVPLMAHNYIITDSRVLIYICSLHSCDALYSILLYCTIQMPRMQCAAEMDISLTVSGFVVKSLKEIAEEVEEVEEETVLTVHPRFLSFFLTFFLSSCLILIKSNSTYSRS